MHNPHWVMFLPYASTVNIKPNVMPMEEVLLLGQRQFQKYSPKPIVNRLTRSNCIYKLNI